MSTVVWILKYTVKQLPFKWSNLREKKLTFSTKPRTFLLRWAALSLSLFAFCSRCDEGKEKKKDKGWHSRVPKRILHRTTPIKHKTAPPTQHSPSPTQHSPSPTQHSPSPTQYSPYPTQYSPYPTKDRPISYTGQPLLNTRQLLQHSSVPLLQRTYLYPTQDNPY